MEIDAPMSQWPQGSNDPTSNPVNQIPTGTAINVFIGNSSNPAISYSFSAIETPTAAPTPSGPTPEYVHWNDTGAGGHVSANVGRMPLNCYNYFYQGQCGEVGFEKIANPPSACANAN
ncbi:MAG TPA: hypothetical protein VKV28_11525 [Candidatus Binataceae bacterium]|nr:hypothetical protein [Candidatus Binataceae bacterium]